VAYLISQHPDLTPQLHEKKMEKNEIKKIPAPTTRRLPHQPTRRSPKLRRARRRERLALFMYALQLSLYLL
jgi:hypothetical protein